MRLGVPVPVSVSLMRTTNRENTAVACDDIRHRSQQESITVSNLQRVNAGVWSSSTLFKLTLSEAPACRWFICSPSGSGVFNSTCDVGFFITPALMLKWSFGLFAAFHWETNLEMQPRWKHTWTSCLTNNLPRYQVAVTNASHLRKIALIVKEPFTPYGGAICWLLFLQNVEGWLLDIGGAGQWAGGWCVPRHSSSQRCFNDL